MRSVLQRVDKAEVWVAGELISSIGKGLLVFIAIARDDQRSDADYLAEKIAALRIFEDDDQKMNLSLLDVKGEILIVSQFTLMADCRKGRRPSFTDAEDPRKAEGLYLYFVNRMRDKAVGVVREGRFQTMMSIQSINDGPVTMLLDSKRFF